MINATMMHQRFSGFLIVISVLASAILADEPLKHWAARTCYAPDGHTLPLTPDDFAPCINVDGIDSSESFVSPSIHY
jgi:hypothetical protein